MAHNKHVDKMIEDAIARGEFDNLRGKGKPINLDAYFATPEDFRLGYSVLKSNEFVPEEVERLRDIGELKAKVAAASDHERPRLQKELNEKELALAIILERNKRRR